MFSTFRPRQLLVVTAAGWVNRDQQAIISYLQQENRVLREQLGKKPFCPETRSSLNPVYWRRARGEVLSS